MINYGATTPANATIVSLELAKQNSKIDFTEEDALLELFLDAAAAEIENYIGAPVLRRENVIIENNVWDSYVFLPFTAEIKSVSWINKLDVETPFLTSDYSFFASELHFNLSEPSEFKKLRITASAGYPDGQIPADIQRAALLIFANADTYRENMPVKLNTSAKTLLRPYKNF